MTSIRCYSLLLANEIQDVCLEMVFLRLACICGNLRVRLATQRYSLCMFTLQLFSSRLSRASHVILFSFITTEYKLLQMIVEPKEDRGSLFWKTVEQFYRFGVGSVAGGEF